ncbi:MAG: hypothetical protein HKN08_02285 [Gammaproteobacteria bacterium]|nr:hypothetical protein [Gammaproteobacteria bacterium]
MNRIITCWLGALLLIVAINGQAAPTGSDLLLACSTAQENGYDSIQGQMCTWYVIPCNCSYDTDIPESCTPEDMQVQELADIVIKHLTGNDALLSQTATKSAAIILAEKFPCDT